MQKIGGLFVEIQERINARDCHLSPNMFQRIYPILLKRIGISTWM
jgi:hypothetical protein